MLTVDTRVLTEKFMQKTEPPSLGGRLIRGVFLKWFISITLMTLNVLKFVCIASFSLLSLELSKLFVHASISNKH